MKRTGLQSFENKEPFKFNLQLFNSAGEGGEGDGVPPAGEGPAGEGGAGEGGGEPGDKIFTQEDLDKAAADAKDKAEKEHKENLKLEKEEAARLAGLSADEREKAIAEKEMEDFKAEKAKFQMEKMELEVIKDLSEKGLPITFAKLLVAEDAETSLENIKKFEISWKEALEKAVLEKLKRPGLKAGGDGVTGTGLGERLAAQKKESETVVKDNPYW